MSNTYMCQTCRYHVTYNNLYWDKDMNAICPVCNKVLAWKLVSDVELLILEAEDNARPI